MNRDTASADARATAATGNSGIRYAGETSATFALNRITDSVLAMNDVVPKA